MIHDLKLEQEEVLKYQVVYKYKDQLPCTSPKKFKRYLGAVNALMNRIHDEETCIDGCIIGLNKDGNLKFVKEYDSFKVNAKQI